MIVEVESNDNCESGIFARFKEAGPPRPVVQVRLYDRNPAGDWYWVTGWNADEAEPVCQAYAQLVEDSGAGLAYLVYGGLYGLRFKPLDIDEPWSLTCARQWDDAYLSLASERDLRFTDSPPTPANSATPFPPAHPNVMAAPAAEPAWSATAGHFVFLPSATSAKHAQSTNKGICYALKILRL